MHVLASTVLALSLAAPDPRTIDPDANRPDIVTDGGAKAPVIPTVPPPAGTTPTVPNRPPPPPPASTPPVTTPPVTTPPVTTPPVTTTPPTTTPTGPSGQPTVTPPPPEPEDDVDRSQRCFAARGRCRRLAIAGIATGALGAVFIGTGIAFTQVGPMPIDGDPVFNRSLAPPGKAVLGVGVAALLAGALLIGSGVAIHRKFQSGEEKLARVRLDARGLHW